MSPATRSVLDDRELVEMLISHPELLAIADALVTTHSRTGVALRPATGSLVVARSQWFRDRRRMGSVAAASIAAVVVLLLLISPWETSPSLAQKALAAVGSGPVLHVVIEEPAAPDHSLRELATGRVVPREHRTEIWFDSARDLKKTIYTLAGVVLDEQLETREGGWTTTGRIYTCAWIAAHPIEATRAGVSCNASGENGTTPRHLPERPPSVDSVLAGFLDHYRSALSSGAATEAGAGGIDGRQVIWLRFNTRNGSERVAIDATSYEPLLVEAQDGTIKLRVLKVEALPFEPTRFAKPEPLRQRSVGGVSTERSVELPEAADLLGGSLVWLGSEWQDLRLAAVKRQERVVDYGDRARQGLMTVIKLEYAPVGANGALDTRRTIDVYESTACVVGVGWTCSARDPASSAQVGLPFGRDGIQLLRRGDLYVSIWGSPRDRAFASLELARALKVLEKQ